MKKKRKRAGKRRRWPCEEEVMRRCDEIVELTDCFCDKHRNGDSRSKSRHKTDDDTVSLFETLEE